MAFGNDRAEADTGLASWYGPGLEGQPTASGEAFDPSGYTAAHNTLPFGTEITVSYAGRSVDVVVNDRGPYSGGRDLDLSQGAAEYLGLTATGVDYVEYEVVGAAGSAANERAGHRKEGRTGAKYEKAKYEKAKYAEADHDSGPGGEAASGGSYAVQPGDTLTRIAAELGTSVNDLMAANGLSDPNYLYAGQTLIY